MSEGRSGPWAIDSDAIGQLTIWSHEHYPIATIVNGAQAQANAQKIAAAPDMLEALEAFVAVWDSYSQDSWEDVYEAAIEAIAKAKGERGSDDT